MKKGTKEKLKFIQKQGTSRLFFLLFLLSATLFLADECRAASAADDIQPNIDVYALIKPTSLNVESDTCERAFFSGYYKNGKEVYLDIIDSGNNISSYTISIDEGGDWKFDKDLSPGDYCSRIVIRTRSNSITESSDNNCFSIEKNAKPTFTVKDNEPQKAFFSGKYDNGSKVYVYVRNEGTGDEYTFSEVIGPDGNWQIKADLPPGNYSARVKIENSCGQLTDYSDTKYFSVKKKPKTSEETILPEEPMPRVLPEIPPTVLEEGAKKVEDLIQSSQEFLRRSNTGLEIATSAGAALSLLPFLLQLNSFKDLLILLQNLPGILLGAARKKKYWGVVYDSHNGQPIPFASINVYDSESGRKLDTKITDKFGEYGFLVKKGRYVIEIIKKNFVFDPLEPNPAVTYFHSYKGEVIQFDKEDLINFEIPMRPLVKEDKLEKPKRKIWDKIITFIFYIGFFISLVILFYNPSLVNFLIVGLYILSGGIRNYGSGKIGWGTVVGPKNNKEAFAVIRVLNKESGEIIARTVSDETGRFYLILQPGSYEIEALGIGGYSWKGHYYVKEKQAFRERLKLRKP